MRISKRREQSVLRKRLPKKPKARANAGGSQRMHAPEAATEDKAGPSRKRKRSAQEADVSEVMAKRVRSCEALE